MDRTLVPSASAVPPRVRRAIVDRARIDTRTLAVFRVFVGVLIVADVLARSRNFHFFYTEEGVVPLELAQRATGDYVVSVYYLTTDPTIIALLFAVQILLALQLIAGYKTRVAIVLSFLFVVSLDHRNTFVLSYADILFRLLLFWAIFLPLGERWSIDAVHAAREPRQSFAGVASVLILCQMVTMYFVNGLHKRQNELWTGGEATPHILGLDHITFLLGNTVRAVPTVLQFGGLGWYYAMLASPLLLLLTGRKRLLFALPFLGGHLMFALTVRIGAFPYVALAGLLLFVQTQPWEDGRRALRRIRGEGTAYATVRSRFVAFARRVPTVRVDGPRLRALRSDGYTLAVMVVFASMLVIAGGAGLQAAGVVDDTPAPMQDVQNTAELVAVDQPDWTIFAPTPSTTDRYYVFAAQTVHNDTYDIYNGNRPLTYDRPEDELQTQYGSYRERFYMNSVRRGGQDHPVTTTYGDYLCETVEEETGVRLVRIEMYVIAETVTMDTTDDHEERERRSSLIHQHGCGDYEPGEIDPPDF